MKKTTFFLFFILAGGFLSAQSYRETRIYVPPIDGEGYIDDMAWFYKQITGEITLQHRSLGKSRRFSDYVITGKLMPLTGENMPPSEVPPDHEHILNVELFDNSLNEVIGNQYITYAYPDEITTNGLSVIMYNLLSAIPDVVELYGAEDNWRNKFIYLNLNFVWNPRVYIGSYHSVNIAGVGAEVRVDVHFLRFMALKAGAEVSQEWVTVYQNQPGITDMILDFPVSVAFVLRPGNLMLEPYIGGNWNVSLLKATRPHPFSWNAGVQLGIKVGAGVLTFDPRFAMDFGKSYINTPKQADRYPYWRYSIHLGIGYKVGFLKR